MSQVLSKVADVLKYKYLPAFANQITTNPTPFLEKVRKAPLLNKTIKAAAPVGLNGGFAFGESDAAATPVAGEQKYIGFSLDAKDIYVDIEISDKTIKLARDNASAMINTLDAEVKGAYITADWNVGRAIFGDGKGILAHITASLSNAATTVYVSDYRKLREGLLVDFYNFASAAATDGTLITSTSPKRILSVSHVYNSAYSGYAVVIDTATTGATTAQTSSGFYGFITCQKSYKHEITGIGVLMDTSADLYGISAANRPAYLNPIVVDANHTITDTVLYGGVRESQDYRNSNIDMLLCGDTAFAAYQDYIRSKNHVVVDNMEFKGGAVGYQVIIGNRKAVVVNERFVPANEIWGVDTTKWTFYHTPLDFADEQGASPFTLLEGKSIYRALFTMYGDLICENPGGCVRFTNCDPT